MAEKSQNQHLFLRRQMLETFFAVQSLISEAREIKYFQPSHSLVGVSLAPRFALLARIAGLLFLFSPLCIPFTPFHKFIQLFSVW